MQHSVESAPVTGEALIKACAQKIIQRDSAKSAIEQRQKEVVVYSKQVDSLQAEIEAMQAAIVAGQPYTPPPAK